MQPSQSSLNRKHTLRIGMYFFGILKIKLLDFAWSKWLTIDSKCSVEQTAGKHKPSEILASTSML